MKIIVAGPRNFIDYSVVKTAIQDAIKKLNLDITEIVSGKATGVDSLGERWAAENEIPVQPFPADWKNIHRKGAVIRVNKFGMKYDAAAGNLRNGQMAKYADGLIIIVPRPITRGTRDMLEQAQGEAKLRSFLIHKHYVLM